MTRLSNSTPTPEQDGAAPRTAADCRRAAMDMLARREHARAELEQKLGRKGYGQDLVGPVLELLVEERMLDDSRFVEAFLASRLRRGQGPVRIAQELHQRGVDEALSARGLAEAEVDWVALARQARSGKFGRRLPAQYPEWARQARFLQYRGFTTEQIRAALDTPPD
jgi:regulatory protein